MSRKEKPDNQGKVAPVSEKHRKLSISYNHVLRTLAIFILVDAMVSTIAFFCGRDLSPTVDIVAFVLVSISLWLLYSSRGFTILLKRAPQKEDCQFLTKEECPYSSMDDCPHNTSHCCAYKQESKGKWKINVLYIVFSISLLVYAASFFIDELNDKEWVEVILRNICLSVIVASIMAFLVDIPGKMKEYQSYFVDLLSSNDYLKRLDEDELMKLREKITWILHMKDIPNMPKGLIKLDNELCNMLRAPFFKEYSQRHDVRIEGELFVKDIKTQYRAFNPYRKTHPVTMDIGLGIELLVPKGDMYSDDNKLIEFVKKCIQINRFSIIPDGKPEEDLCPGLQIVIKRRNEYVLNGLVLDGQDRVSVHIINKQAKQSVEDENANKGKKEISVIIDQSIDEHFYYTFEDKIQVELDYCVRVTNKDPLFTKKLRYPVKYLYFDYAIDGKSEYTLDGQIIGTMIEPSEKLINLSTDKKRITMRTNSWLLPKNGVVVVINKNK